MEYVIWGAGERGARIFPHLDSDSVKAFVDGDANKIGNEYLGKAVISFQEYKKRYRHCYVIISVSHEDDVVSVLEENDIYHYFLLSECPGEFQESYPRDILKDFVINYVEHNRGYLIYGCTLYSMILREWIEQKLEVCVKIVPHIGVNAQLLEQLKLQKPDDNINNLEELDLDGIDEIFVTIEEDLEIVRNHVSEEIAVTNVYDCSDRIEMYYNPKIEKYRNIHNGKRCFIVATGPSLKMEDLDALAAHKEICISLNSIWRAFGATKWRPQYYLAMDYRSIRDYKEIIEKENIACSFWGDTYKGFDAVKYNERNLLHHFVYEYSEKKYPKFSEDFARKSYHGSTVTYNALQLAVYMGFKDIYLLGVDFSYIGQSKDVKYGHFYKEKKFTSVGYERQVYLAYLSAKKYADEHGIKIYNATRGGKLEVFERVDFDSLF